MLAEAVAIGGLGLAAALGLGVAARIFAVEVDPLVEAVEEALPGANCGGCGYAGCSSAAVAIASGQAEANVCVGGGPEVAIAVAAIMGVEVVETEPQVARVGCRYPVSRSDLKYKYAGVEDCRGAVLIAGGPKECPVGCLGLGSCVRACPFGALSLGSDGLPVVDENLCTGCGSCVRTCPQGIMGLTSVTDRILGEFTDHQCTAPCQRTCPAGINIPEQIRQTAMGDYEQALRVIKERNPLPLICGRICPHPCEFECRRNLADQEPVAINPLKRFVADRERESGQRLPLYCAPATGRRVAVVGGGVEGLTTAAFLARLGHSPVIFEAQSLLGGLLRTVIPPHRLPREVLDWEIEGILELGVEARTGQVLGRDFTLASLFDQDFKAVFLATGGWDSILMQGDPPRPAPALPGLLLSLPLTMSWARGQEPALGDKVVIVGGGRGALALASRCLDKGAQQVEILWRRPQEAMGLDQEELDQARKRGIGWRFDCKVIRLEGVDEAITGLVYRSDGDRPAVENSLAADTVIGASGRLPEIILVPAPGQEERQAGQPMAWRTAQPYRDPLHWPQGIFEADDEVRDYQAAVRAIGAGRRAAASLHALLTGQEPAPPEGMLAPGQTIIDVSSLNNLMEVGPRQAMPLADPEARLDWDREVELGLDEKAARAEAARCLNCGLICYYRAKYN